MAAAPNIITRDNFTGQQVPPPNNTAVGWGYWNGMDDAPSAELYGVGPAWIGGKQYWSDGDQWALIGEAPTVQSPKNYDICIIGDSLSVAGMSGPGTGTNPIVVTGGVCELDNGSACDIGVGNTFYLDYTANENLNMRQCVVTDQRTRNIIRFVVNGYTPPDGTIAKSAAANITPNFDQTYRNIQGLIDWTNALLGSPFTIKFHLSRNGYRVDELYAKVQTRLDDIATCGWAYIYIGTNSVNATDTYGTMPEVWAQMEQIYKWVLNTGANLILPTLPPVTTSQWNSSDGRRPRLYYINNRIRQFAAQNASRVILVDVFRILASNSTIYGEYIADTSADGLHIGPRGALLCAQSLAKQFAPVIPPRKAEDSLIPDIAPACGFDTLADLNAAGFSDFVTNMVDNPTFAGTGGSSGTGITGSTPDNWNTSRGGTGTATIAVATGPIDSTRELTFTITSAAANDRVYLTQTINTGISAHAGKKVRVGLTIDVVSCTALKQVLLDFTQNINGSVSGSFGVFTRVGSNNQPSGTAGINSTAPGRYTLVSAPFVLQTPTSSVFSVEMGFWDVGAAVIKLSNPFIVLVD